MKFKKYKMKQSQFDEYKNEMLRCQVFCNVFREKDYVIR